MGLMRDLTPNPLSMNGEGARARRNRLNYRSFPLSIHGEGAGGEVSRRCVPDPSGHRSSRRWKGGRHFGRHLTVLARVGYGARQQDAGGFTGGGSVRVSF